MTPVLVIMSSPSPSRARLGRPTYRCSDRVVIISYPVSKISHGDGVLYCTVVRDALTSINITLPVVKGGSASDYVVTLTSLNRVQVHKGRIVRRVKKTGNDRVVTITSINNTLVVNAIIASYYVVIITSIDGRKVFDTDTLINCSPPLPVIMSFPLPVFISPSLEMP
jgi:hypothetical protein